MMSNRQEHNKGGGRGFRPKAWQENVNNSTVGNTNVASSRQGGGNMGHNAKFLEYQEKLKQSVNKHLEQQDGLDSSEEEDNLETEKILSSVLKNYSLVGGTSDHIARTQQFLEDSFQSGAGICLICLASMKRADPIWSCVECYGYFHLICIQKWSRDNIFQQKQAIEDLPNFQKPKKINWACPKCRHDYEEDEVPNRYFCFCGATEDPPHHPWLVPHSCGETCSKPLQPVCGHQCLLLCHPGPCPPCPKTVKSPCHCQKQPAKARRCSDKLWSCGGQCNKALQCGKHRCQVTCHDGPCPPCQRESLQMCVCGTRQSQRLCAHHIWQCDKVCGVQFNCGHHSCKEICHRHEVSRDCPLSEERSCPCGATLLTLPCTQDAPTCNGTCGKLLECGAHMCEQKCHRDACGMCREIVSKICRCGQHRKEVPCRKEFLCETKCKRTKNCLRHPCNRKCCDSNCPPCEKPCGRTLGCGNHKCPSLCHRGPCYPCPRTDKIVCPCGSTDITVPCGRAKRKRPLKCNELCRIPPDCDHEKRENHKCHLGNCPPCRQKCLKPHPACPHPCTASCHIAVWVKIEQDHRPAGPWEVQGPQFKKSNFPCPPCEVPVPITCLGAHETAPMPCHRARPLSCGRPCGRNLSCSNHVCLQECHPPSVQCTPCNSECLKPRPEGCSHSCPRPCHPGNCPLCKATIKNKCHCSVGVQYVQCGILCFADEDARNALLSCGADCPKTYPCGHPCRAKCHPGDCPDAELCRRKVKMSCPCGRMKKDLTCELVRTSKQTVDCDDTCVLKKKEIEKAKEMEALKKKEEEERKNKEEVEKFEKKFQGKKKTRERNRWKEEEESSWFKTYWYLLAAATVGVSAIAYLIFT